ncbi:MAG: hypothetical protein WBD37_15500, partial [Anderseniella sp.]
MTESNSGTTSTVLLIKTKLYQPRIVSDALPRPHLVQQLHAGLTSPLTLICAPAGYGKTSLLAAWLPQVPHPVAWLSLDETDSDPLIFLHYVVAALRTIVPTAAAKLERTLNSPTAFSIEYIALTLIHELENLVQECVLVLDDYHLIQDNSPVHHILRMLIKYQLPHIHLVIASRNDPPFSLARLRSQNQLTEVRTQALSFDIEETRLYLQKFLKNDIPPAAVVATHNWLEGWPAGVCLAAFSMQQQGNFEAFAREPVNRSRFVMDYFADEVLAHLPSLTQHFLLQSAILERCSAALCATVTEMSQEQCQAILAWLVQHNLFTVVIDYESQWYRLHPLFRELLTVRLRIEATDVDRMTLHKRASDWFAKHGLIEEALHHALAAGEYGAAVTLIEQHRHTLMNSEHFRTLEHLIIQLPNEWVERSPALLLSKAWVAVAE